MTRRTSLPLSLVLLVLVLTACSLVAVTPSPSPSASPVVTPAVAPSLSGPTAAPTASPSAAPSFVSYTVARGDTLHAIARRFETTWQSLIFWNKDRYGQLNPDDPSWNPDAIQAGWTLGVVPGTRVIYQPVPAPSITPSPSPEPATPTPAPGEPSRVVTSGSRARPQIALTLDMGGRIDPAVEIMNWLVENEIKATIFPTGEMVENPNTDAGRRALAIVDEHPDLFALGNHSYSHPDFRSLSQAEMRDQLTRTETAFAAITERSARPLFRPPFGGYDSETLAVLGNAGYPYTIMWDVDTIDWRPTNEGGPTADDIVAKVVSQSRNGSIVLMHLGGYHTLDALPVIVREMHERGYTFVTVPEMLGL